MQYSLKSCNDNKVIARDESNLTKKTSLRVIYLELGRFAHRTLNNGNIGDKLNTEESVALVCRFVIVTRRRALNKPHSHVSSTRLRVLDRWPTGNLKRSYVIIIVTVRRSA